MSNHGVTYHVILIYIALYVSCSISHPLPPPPPPPNTTTSDLKRSAATGIAFIAAVGFIYIVTVIYLYKRTKYANIEEEKGRQRSMSMVSTQDLDDDLQTASETDMSHIPWESGPIRQVTTYTRTSPKRRSSSNSPINSAASRVSSSANGLDNITTNTSINIKSTGKTEKLDFLSNTDDSDEYAPSIAPKAVKVSSDSSAQNDSETFNPLQDNVAIDIESPDLFTSNSDRSSISMLFRANYDGQEGHEPFFSRHQQNVLLDAKDKKIYTIVSKKSSFNESLSNLVSLFDGTSSSMSNKWVSFSLQNLMDQNQAQQLVDVVSSCAHDAITKGVLSSNRLYDEEWGLCLNRCHLASEEAYSIAQAVILHPINSLSLTQLDLSHNNLDDTFVMLLGKLSMLSSLVNGLNSSEDDRLCPR